MRRAWMAVALCAACVLASGVAGAGPVSGDPLPGDEIAIQVAPGTIALNAQTVWLTIHADISFGTVATESVTVTINGQKLAMEPGEMRIFADSIGDLVVKVPIRKVKPIVEGVPSAAIVLDGDTLDGEFFWGSDTVEVKPGSRK